MEKHLELLKEQFNFVRNEIERETLEEMAERQKIETAYEEEKCN